VLEKDIIDHQNKTNQPEVVQGSLQKCPGVLNKFSKHRQTQVHGPDLYVNLKPFFVDGDFHLCKAKCKKLKAERCFKLSAFSRQLTAEIHINLVDIKPLLVYDSLLSVDVALNLFYPSVSMVKNHQLYEKECTRPPVHVMDNTTCRRPARR
jgi:hypothetical protein